MCLQICDFKVLDQGVRVRDAGIGNHEVEVVDALLLELLDGLEGVRLDGCVGLDDDQLTIRARGNVGEGLRRDVLGIAIGGDDNVVRLREEQLQQALAQAAIGATN